MAPARAQLRARRRPPRRACRVGHRRARAGADRPSPDAAGPAGAARRPRGGHHGPGRPLGAFAARRTSRPAGASTAPAARRCSRVAPVARTSSSSRTPSELNDAISRNRLLVGALAAGVSRCWRWPSSVFVSRALQAQIGKFLEAARRLAGGRFDDPVPVEGQDEFAQLGREFNSMSGQLEGQIEEVERKRRELETAIRRVGEAFASGLDRQGIFELAVQNAVQACEAESGPRAAARLDAARGGDGGRPGRRPRRGARGGGAARVSRRGNTDGPPSAHRRVGTRRGARHRAAAEGAARHERGRPAPRGDLPRAPRAALHAPRSPTCSSTWSVRR